MIQKDQDRKTLEDILLCCHKLSALRERFGDREAFRSDAAYQDAAAMNILQIGELAKRLSPEFRAVHTTVPWRSICGMRDFLAHQYTRVDLDALWETIDHRLSALIVSCEKILE